MVEQPLTRRRCLSLATKSVIGLAGLSSVTRALAAEGYEVRNDVEFRHGPVSLKLDAHLGPGKGPRPAVILVHGGGWTGGSKTANFIQPLFPVLDQTGYSWFSIDYRLAPAYPYKAMIDDVETAIAFVKKNAKEFKVDPKRIVLMGESAGAHLVNLVGLRNKTPADVAGVVSFYGPIDIMETLRLQPGGPVSDTVKKVFEIEALDAAGLAKMKEGSPDTYIHKGSAPFLFIHGTKDDPVPYNQSSKGVEMMTKAGAKADLITVEDGIHGVINWEKDPKFHGYKAEMIAWLKRRLGS